MNGLKTKREGKRVIMAGKGEKCWLLPPPSTFPRWRAHLASTATKPFSSVSPYLSSRASFSEGVLQTAASDSQKGLEMIRGDRYAWMQDGRIYDGRSTAGEQWSVG